MFTAVINKTVQIEVKTTLGLSLVIYLERGHFPVFQEESEMLEHRYVSSMRETAEYLRGVILQLQVL